MIMMDKIISTVEWANHIIFCNDPGISNEAKAKGAIRVLIQHDEMLRELATELAIAIDQEWICQHDPDEDCTECRTLKSLAEQTIEAVKK